MKEIEKRMNQGYEVQLYYSKNDPNYGYSARSYINAIDENNQSVRVAFIHFNDSQIEFDGGYIIADSENMCLYLQDLYGGVVCGIFHIDTCETFAFFNHIFKFNRFVVEITKRKSVHADTFARVN